MMRAWVLRLRRIWGLILAIGTAALGVSDQFLPAFQGMIPPLAYAGLAVTLAILPSIIERRDSKRK